MIYSRQHSQSRGSPTNPGGRIADVNTLGGIMGEHPGNPYRAFYDADADGAVDDGELLFAMDDGDGNPARDSDGVVILNPAGAMNPVGGVAFNEDVDIANLRLFGKLGTLPSNLDESGANLGYSTFDTTALRLANSFTYSFENGWDVRASWMRQRNVDPRQRKNQSYRAVLLGLEGRLGPDPTNDGPDTYNQWYNPFSTSALNCEDRVCTDPGAAVNPNLGDFPNTQYVADTIDINAWRMLKSKLDTLDLITTGDLFEGWAGTIAGAFGLSYQRTNIDWDPRSDEKQCNNWYDSCSLAYNATEKIWGAYFEFSVPLLDSETFGYADIQLAGRYSDVKDIGDSFDPKIAARWEPVNWMALRASFSTAFIPPSIVDRFQPATSFLQSTNDKVFGDYEGTYRTNVSRGNPDLVPETADIYNLGISFSLVDDSLHFGMDYSDYKFQDRISLLTGARVVDADFENFLIAYPQADESSPVLADSIAWVQSGLANESIARTGAPSYTIVEVQAERVNADEMHHQSIDLYTDWSLFTDSVGSFRFDVQATHIVKYDYQIGKVSGSAVGQENLSIDVIPPLPRVARGRFGELEHQQPRVVGANSLER